MTPTLASILDQMNAVAEPVVEPDYVAVKPDGWPVSGQIVTRGDGVTALRGTLADYRVVDFQVTSRGLRYDSPCFTGPALRVRVLLADEEGNPPVKVNGWALAGTSVRYV